ncbi:MAG: MlaE family lipid ABC transporter permease subunit [Candidatus Cloacimonetes bacterium]|nr:MlaE family lipid ABC transporter permease subunit [Candidatus Cloacimonadota bacterium]
MGKPVKNPSKTSLAPLVQVQGDALILSGELIFSTVPAFGEQTSKILKKEKPVMLDISGVQRIDSSGVAYLEELQLALQSRKAPKAKEPKPGIFLLKGINDNTRPVLETFSSLKLPDIPMAEHISFFEGIGSGLVNGFKAFGESLVIAADVFFWSFYGLGNRSGQRKGSFVQQGVALGVQALPIVALLSFIIGFILSLQSAVQLRNFGANIFIADLLAVTMVREMGPMLTAIIVAGRSGSAIASEIATMQVTEEIDALKMMAINPVRYVVVPKFHAISVVMPILVAFSILVGELGGLLIAIGYLDLSLESFVNRTIEILTLKDLVVSMAKSIWFAWVIVVIGSYYGFQVKGGAEGVGKATTASVVASIFAVILFDALFSLLYL